MIFRQGRRNPQTIYLQRGPEPSDENDEFVLTAVGGRTRGGYFAKLTVEALNRAGLPPAR